MYTEKNDWIQKNSGKDLPVYIYFNASQFIIRMRYKEYSIGLLLLSVTQCRHNLSYVCTSVRKMCRYF